MPSSEKRTLTKEERLAKLKQNLPKETQEVIVARDEERRIQVLEKIQASLRADPFDADIVLDTDNDTEFARKTIKGLINDSDQTLKDLRTFAGDLETPRGYEVLAGMMKTIADLSKDLVELQQGRKKIRESRVKNLQEAGNKPGANVNVFVGTTTDLQKRMREAEKEIAIDV